MYKLALVKAIFCVALVVVFKNVSAQTDSDSSVYKQAVVNLITHFDQGMDEGARLYNGFGFTPYSSDITGNAFLDDNDSWRMGTVNYDGETFANVPMIYDIYADNLIVLLHNHGAPYRLVSERVVSFDLRDHRYVRISGIAAGIKAGFYEQLYGGKSTVVNKLEKELSTTNLTSGNVASTHNRYFAPKNEYHQYYIRKGNTYYSVNSQGSVLDLFKDKKKELRQYIKDNHIQFDSFPEASMVKIATYYDHLTD